MSRKQASPPAKAPRVDKRIELLEHALECLSVKGYAQTTLRDIASESGMSLGRLHYYFESKEALIAMVVSHYKEAFMVSMFSAFEGADNVDDMLAQIIDEYIRTIRTSARTHRLWYDMRVQALFDDKFRHVVEPIQDALRSFFPRLLEKMAEVLGASALPDVDTEALYLMTDALFFRALQDDVTNNKLACKRLRTSLEGLFAATLIPAANAMRKQGGVKRSAARRNQGAGK